MTILEAIRAKQDKIINDDKTSIVITRVSKTEGDAGGYTQSTSTLDSQDVRLYRVSTARAVLNTTVNEGGYVQTSTQKMLAKYDADVKRKTATNTDTFTVGTKTYEVIDVIDITVGSNIVFKECYIKEV